MERVATLKDIANELGVSTSTVSRILNGKNQQNKVLVEKVHEAAKKLNYQVNTAALGLRTNKTRLIGIIVPYISDEFFSSILAGIESATEAKGYNLLICQSNESHAKEKKLIKSLLACNVEGILISLSREAKDLSFLDFLIDSGKKAVLFDRVLKQEKYPTVLFDDHQAAYQAGQHLIATGKRSFLYVGLSPNLENDKERLRGYNSALAEHGLPPCTACYAHDIAGTAPVVKEMLKEHSYDAVACHYDLIAVEVISLLKKTGVRIPEEVAVCGFDNRHICDFISPTLTSVDHSTARMGEVAANSLLAMLNDEEPDLTKVKIGSSLVVRESTVGK